MWPGGVGDAIWDRFGVFRSEGDMQVAEDLVEWGKFSWILLYGALGGLLDRRYCKQQHFSTQFLNIGGFFGLIEVEVIINRYYWVALIDGDHNSRELLLHSRQVVPVILIGLEVVRQ